LSTRDIETAQVDLAVVRGVIEDAAKHLSSDEAKVLFGLLDSHLELMRLLQQKGTTIVRLRRLFGLKKTERLETLMGDSGRAATTKAEGESETVHDAGDAESSNASATAAEPACVDDSDAEAPTSCESAADKSRKPRSAGRRSSADYQGPETFVPHAELCRGDDCVLCNRGKVYPFRSVICIVIRGQPSLAADKFRLEALRCNTCGAVFNAEPPAEAKGPKYRPSSIAILAALHYTFGMPFHRQDKLQELLGVPVPASTQWKLMNESEPVVRPAYDALKRHAAKSHVFHIDDTYLQLLDPAGTVLPPSPNGCGPPRTGQYTTGVLAVDRDGRRVALFVTGRKHAGENIVDLMKHRPPGPMRPPSPRSPPPRRRPNRPPPKPTDSSGGRATTRRRHHQRWAPPQNGCTRPKRTYAQLLQAHI
jgi:Transposase IS66 family